MQKRSRRINENSKQGRIWAKTDGYCHLCGTRLYVGEWHLDHIVPRVHQGADDEHNLLRVLQRDGESGDDIQDAPFTDVWPVLPGKSDAA